jgi:hypothetical protein
MQTLTEILSSAEFWRIALLALVAIGAWFLNGQRFRVMLAGKRCSATY